MNLKCLKDGGSTNHIMFVKYMNPYLTFGLTGEFRDDKSISISDPYPLFIHILHPYPSLMDRIGSDVYPLYRMTIAIPIARLPNRSKII